MAGCSDSVVIRDQPLFRIIFQATSNDTTRAASGFVYETGSNVSEHEGFARFTELGCCVQRLCMDLFGYLVRPSAWPRFSLVVCTYGKRVTGLERIMNLFRGISKLYDRVRGIDPLYRHDLNQPSRSTSRCRAD